MPRPSGEPSSVGPGAAGSGLPGSELQTLREGTELRAEAHVPRFSLALQSRE